MRFPTFGLRTQPRVPVASLCNTVVDERDQMALVVDLSEQGLRLERPLRGSGAGRVVQLEFEIPEIDEIVWARGEVCFDQLRAVAPTQAARVAVRATGVRIVAAASRHLRLIREYVQLAGERQAALAGAAAAGVATAGGEPRARRQAAGERIARSGRAGRTRSCGQADRARSCGQADREPRANGHGAAGAPPRNNGRASSR